MDNLLTYMTLNPKIVPVSYDFKSQKEMVLVCCTFLP